MKKMKKFCATVMALLMIAALSIPTLAAATYDVIESVSFDLGYSIEAGSDGTEIWMTNLSGGYTVTKLSVTNGPDEDEKWDEGDKPKVTIVLEVMDDDKYRFDSSWKKADVSIGDDDVTINSVSSSNSGRKLTIKVTLPELEYDDEFLASALEIEDAEWNIDEGIAEWEENDYAKRYEVKIYRNGSSVGGTLKTTDNEYDLSKYFTKKGDYYFKVRAVRSSTVAGEWYESEEIYVDSDEAKDIRESGSGSSSSSSSTSNSSTSGPGVSTSSGAWLKDSVGWWWCNADRTYPTSAWKYINNKWYYFNSAGYCVQNGWVQTNNIWYYCGPDGDMWVSRWTPDGYYVNANGEWVQ